MRYLPNVGVHARLQVTHDSHTYVFEVPGYCCPVFFLQKVLKN